jgi:hypothetical protein
MLCRGFKRKFYSLQEFRAGAGSVAFFLLMCAAALGIAVLEVWPGLW